MKDAHLRERPTASPGIALAWAAAGFGAVILGWFWWALLHDDIGLSPGQASGLTLLFALLVVFAAARRHWVYLMAVFTGALAVWPSFWLWFFWSWSRSPG